MIKSSSIIKKLLIYAFPILAFILCLFASETAQAGKKALYLCIDVVIPSLFPFFALSGIITPFISGFSCPVFFKRLIEKFLKLPYYTLVIILLGFISGYPNGAKLTRDMFNEGLIDSQQATKLLTKANYCSPLFVVGTVGAGLFKSLKLGLFLLLIHWISGILASLITEKINKSKKSTYIKPQAYQKKSVKPKPLSVLLTSSIESAAILCVKLTGYIVFFAVAAELLSQLGVFSFLGKSLAVFYQGDKDSFSNLITSTIRGFMEITSGAQAINQVKGVQLNMQLASISLIFGFAGFSAHTQIIGIMSGTGTKYSIFLTAKLLHGILGFFLTLIIIYLMPMTVETSTIGAIPSLPWPWGRPIIVIALLISLIGPSLKFSIKSRAK